MYNDIAMKKYVTTNIRLAEVEYRTLKLRAARDKKSLASLVRDAVSRTYGTQAQPPMTEEEWRKDPIWKMVGMFEGHPDDSDVDQIYTDDDDSPTPPGA